MKDQQKPIHPHLALAIIAFAMLAVFLTGYGFGVYTQTLAIDEFLRSEGIR